MSIIITGLKMSTERESFNLTIKYNGTVLDTETGCQVAEAHELPPHGRLGDLDRMLADNEIYYNQLGRADGEIGARYRSVKRSTELAPTIIPAEEG